MENNSCEELTIKINWQTDVYFDDNGICKFKDTNLPLNGIYEDEEGNVYYFKNGKRHNENGPSYVTTDGYKEYRINGKYHRIDGPAVIYADVPREWWINGYRINNEVINNWLTENDIPLDYKIWSNEDKMLFALYWSDYTI